MVLGQSLSAAVSGGLLGNTTTPKADRGLNNRNPAYSKSVRGPERQVYNKESRPSGFNGRNSDYGRPPVIERGINRSPGGARFPGTNQRTFSRPETASRQSGANYQRPSPSQTRSFSPPSRVSERSSSSSPQVGGKHLNSSPATSRGFSGYPQGGNRGSSFGHGGSRL